MAYVFFWEYLLAIKCSTKYEIIHKKEFENLNFFQAYYGFTKLGFEIIFFDDLPATREKEDIVVDFIGGIKKAVRSFGLLPPDPLDFLFKMSTPVGNL